MNSWINRRMISKTSLIREAGLADLGISTMAGDQSSLLLPRMLHYVSYGVFTARLQGDAEVNAPFSPQGGPEGSQISKRKLDVDVRNRWGVERGREGVMLEVGRVGLS